MIAMVFDNKDNTYKLVTIDELFSHLRIDTHIYSLKSFQREHGLFLDLEEDKVRETYFKRFPNGADYLDFLYMICDMTNENVLSNEMVINDINIMKEKRKRKENTPLLKEYIIKMNISFL